MLEVASFVGVDEVVILGDYADFISVSGHDKGDPRLPAILAEEIESVNQGLDELDRLFPRAKKVFLEGNHEYRLERYIYKNAPALFGLSECKELFRIPQRPLWSYLSYGRNQSHRVLGTELYARHTPLASSAKTSLTRAMTSHCYGHIHRPEEHRHVGLDGKTYVAFSPGWLGDPRAKVFDYLHVPANWSWGFALVSSSSSKEFHHEIVHVRKDFSCLAQGKRFKI